MNTPDDQNPSADPQPDNLPAGPGDAQPKTFTQDEVNAMMGRTRQESKAQFSDYDTLKARALKADELEAAKTTAERKAIDAVAFATDTAIRSEIRVKAAQVGVVDVDAVYALVDRDAISYSEESGVTGVDEALTQLLTDKPFLKGKTTPAPNLNPAVGRAAETVVPLTDGEKAMAHKLFRTKSPAEAEAEYAAGKR